MSAKIQPLAEYVVAVSEEPETKTASGLYLPDNATEKPKVAKAIAVGKDVKQIKVGDRIIYKHDYNTTDVKLGSEKYIVVKEEDILATIQ
jgi:chaperonin GroES